MEIIRLIYHALYFIFCSGAVVIALLVASSWWTSLPWARWARWHRRFKTRGLTDKSGQSRDAPGTRRIIKTARTENEINEAAAAGLRPLVKTVNRDDKIYWWMTVFQHPMTGEVRTGGHRRRFEGFEATLQFKYYPYNFPSPIAAYLVPPDLEFGESVWLDDIIEDIVRSWGPGGGGSRLEQWVAIWDGAEFVIQFNPVGDAQHYKG